MILRRSKQAVPAPTAVPAAVVPQTPHPMIAKAAQVEAALADARRDLAAAQTEVLSAKHAYDAAADAARVSEAVAARTRSMEAEVRADVAARLVARLEEELEPLLAGAADVAAAQERETLRETAQQAVAEYEAAFRTRMPSITAELRGLIRLWAQAELARETAESHGAQIPAADTFRHVAGSYRQDIGREEVDLWINPGSGTPFGDADQRKIKQRRDGVGTLEGNNYYTHEATHKRRFARITYLPFSTGKIAPALYEALLPCLHASGVAGWSPLKAGASPRVVLEALNALEAREAAGPGVDREPAVEDRAIEPARDVRLNPDPAPYRESYGPYGSLDREDADAATVSEG